MAYEKYKTFLTKKEYYQAWDKFSLDTLTPAKYDYIYNKYTVKFKVFNRDNFTCQNHDGEDGKCSVCDNEKNYPKLRMHHIKFRKNNGQDKERNCITICHASHTRYHQAKGSLIFLDVPTLPPHIRKQVFRLKKPERTKWKEYKEKVKDIRTELRSKLDKAIKELPIGKRTWFKASKEEILMLMMWLTVPYYEIDNLDDDDDENEDYDN